MRSGDWSQNPHTGQRAWDPGNAVDIGASGAERRSLRRKARPTTVSSIGELRSMRSWRSELRASAFPRLLGSKGLPGTPSPAGSRRQPKCVVVSTVKRSLESLWKSFKRMRSTRSSAARAAQRASSRRSKSGPVSGLRPSSDVEATETLWSSFVTCGAEWIF